jgi:hypothetical protein
VSELQRNIIQTLGKQDHVIQVHGFYYDKEKDTASVDVVIDRTITDDQAFILRLQEQLKAAVPGTPVSIIIDHNYSD